MNTYAPRIVIYFLISVGLSSCGGDGYRLPDSPSKISVDPKDHGLFDKIMKSPVDERLKAQVSLLQKQGHDLEWYDSKIADVKANDAVQLIYFGSKNRVLGFCTGSFLSNEFVATAAHCNSLTEEVQKSGADCRGVVIFAHKAQSSSDIDYYECGKLNEQSYVSENQNLRDHALFQIAQPSSGVSQRASFSKSVDLFGSTRDISSVTKLVSGKAAIGLFIDPPQSYANLKSAYSVVIGKVVSPSGNYSGLHIESLISNFAKAGNSGGPIYVSTESYISGTPLIISESSMSYMAPLIGEIQTSTQTLILSGNPSVVLSDFARLMGEGS